MQVDAAPARIRNGDRGEQVMCFIGLERHAEPDAAQHRAFLAG